jgi:hypothetical protein
LPSSGQSIVKEVNKEKFLNNMVGETKVLPARAGASLSLNVCKNKEKLWETLTWSGEEKNSM